MRVIEICVSAFGGVRDLRLPLTEGLNTLHRPNGWGKTTLAVFIKAMLYGIAPVKGGRAEDNERKKYAPWQGGVFGGSMSFESAKGRFRVERFFGARESADTFSLYDLSTNMESDAYSSHLGEELFGIDAEGFARTVYLSHGAPLPKGESVSLSARLASLVEAADDVGDYDSAAEVLEKRSRYYLTTGNRGQIPTLEGELIALERTREELFAERKTLDTKQSEMNAMREELGALEEETGRIRASLHSAARAREVTVLRTQRQTLSERLLRIQSRVRVLDAEAGGKHPSDDAIRRARERWKEYGRLAAEAPVPEVPAVGGGLAALAGVMLVTSLILLAVGAFTALPLLLFLGAALLALGALTGILWGRKRASAAQRTRGAEALRASRREAMKDAEAALTKALLAIGATVDACPDAIETVAEREIEYRLLRTELREARGALEAFDAAHPTLPASAGATRAQDADALAAREQTLVARMNALRTRYAEVSAAVERLSVHTESIPDVEAAIAEKRETLEAAREAYETLVETQKHLRAAKASLSTRYLDRMETRMCAYLETLSPNAPTPVPDATLSISVRTDTGTHKLSQLSSGWQDLIDLCARLSLADVLFEGAETPLLILDDPFVNLDDAHLHAGKLLLASLSARYQILYTVCHADRG